MLKVNIYRIVGSNSQLRTEEIRDARGNVLFTRDHESDEVADKQMQYDQKNRLISETQVLNEQEIEKRTFSYLENGEVKEEQHYIQGELYSETKFEIKDDGYVQAIWEDNELIEQRIIEVMPTGRTITIQDANGELVQKSVQMFNETRTESTTEVYDKNNKLNGTLIESFDAQQRLIKAEEYGPENEFYGATQLTFENELLIEEAYSNYNKNAIVSTVTYTYDENKNLVQLEERDQSGNLQRANVWVYNEEGRIEVEKGLKVGNYDPVFGTGENSNNFELRYEYEEMP